MSHTSSLLWVYLAAVFVVSPVPCDALNNPFMSDDRVLGFVIGFSVALGITIPSVIVICWYRVDIRRWLSTHFPDTCGDSEQLQATNDRRNSLQDVKQVVVSPKSGAAEDAERMHSLLAARLAVAGHGQPIARAAAEAITTAAAAKTTTRDIGSGLDPALELTGRIPASKQGVVPPLLLPGGAPANGIHASRKIPPQQQQIIPQQHMPMHAMPYMYGPRPPFMYMAPRPGPWYGGMVAPLSPAAAQMPLYTPHMYTMQSPTHNPTLRPPSNTSISGVTLTATPG